MITVAAACESTAGSAAPQLTSYRSRCHLRGRDAWSTGCRAASAHAPRQRSGQRDDAAVRRAASPTWIPHHGSHTPAFGPQRAQHSRQPSGALRRSQGCAE